MTASLQVLLSELERFGEANDNATAERPRRMLIITRDTGEFLSVLVQATSARRVLEIGTSNGYSTLWLASAAGATGGAVTTVELSDYKVGLARQNSAVPALLPPSHCCGRRWGVLKALATPRLTWFSLMRSARVSWLVPHPSACCGLVDCSLSITPSHPEQMAPFVALVSRRRFHDEPRPRR
jgi:hypothetical protein